MVTKAEDWRLKHDISVFILNYMAGQLKMKVDEYGLVYDSEKHEDLLNSIIRLVVIQELALTKQHEKQLQLARIEAKIEEQQNMKHWLVSEELNTASHSGFGQMIKNAQSVVDLRIAKLTSQKAHLTTKGGDHE